ncbi:hypothetical protein ACFL1R_11590 [Candidatus Latescibacterota bacterium]
MRKLCLFLILFVILPSFSYEKTLRDYAGFWGKYEVIDGKSSIPGLTHIMFSLPAVESVNGSDAVWFQLEAFSGNERLYSIAFLAASLDFLYPGDTEVDVKRYILVPADGSPIEYVSKSTGRAVLPIFDFFKNLLPHAKSTADPDMPFFIKGTYLGKSLLRIENGKGAGLVSLKDIHRIELETDVLIGTSRSIRDDGSGRLYIPEETDPSYADPPGSPDYNYVELTENDYRKMIDAGFNIFRVPFSHLAYVIDQSVWFLVRSGFDKLPDILYRSNFFGAVMYMDEPAVRLLAHHMLAEFQSPQRAAEILVDITRGRYEGDSGYGMRNLDKLLRESGYNFGNLEILQPDYPVWETLTSAFWYEYEAGAAGIVHEGRYQSKRFAEMMKKILDVEFPDDVESCLKFHHAFFRGAARRFGGKWGVSIYGQMTFDAAEKVFPMAYENGAAYFWFWTSDHSHHVPFQEQLEHARKFRNYIKAHPRQSTPGGLTARARKAIALPWGYLLDETSIAAWRFKDTSRPSMLWWSMDMELDDVNSHGVPYKEVLRAAVKEAVKLLKQGAEFDFIYLRRGEKAEGYDEVRRIQENGEVVYE